MSLMNRVARFARSLARGAYRFRVTARRGGRTVTATLSARRL